MKNHNKITRVNGSNSSNKVQNINIGVPQGSCLVPLLFLIDVNDLSDIVNSASIYMYPDGTSLSFSTISLRSVCDKLDLSLVKSKAYYY